MTAKNGPTKLIAVVIALVAAAVIFEAWTVRQVVAIQDMPSPISIAIGQTLQLNVANTSSGDPIPIEMMILDDTGNPLKRSRELVMPLHTTVLMLNRDEVGGRAASRLLTRALVRVVGNPNDLSAIVLSEEVVQRHSKNRAIASRNQQRLQPAA